MTANTPLSGMAAAWAEAQVRVHEALAPHARRRADERVSAWLEDFEADMRAVIAPHLAEYVEHPDTPPEVKELLATAVSPEHQTQAGILFAVLAGLAYPLISALMTARVQALEQLVLRGDPNTKLTPGEAVVAAIKAAAPYSAMEAEAANAGVDPGRFKIMHDATGNPPALGELLLLLRRRQINDLRFQQGIEQSLLRNDWSKEWLALRFGPIGAGEAVAGALKGHLTDTAAQGMVAEAGIDPANYPWMNATAGRPPGIEQMVQLWNHAAAGLPGFTATQQDVSDAVRQSDINDHFLPFVLQSRWYIPPVRSILPMLRAGAITDAHASQLLSAHGVRPEDIQTYLNEGHHARTGAVKELSMSLVQRMYEARIIDGATATARLAALGYNAADAGLILRYADDSRHEKAVNALVSRLHSLYVSHAVDATQVTNDLGAAGLPGAAITDYLHLWGLERTANVHRLSPAAIVGAYRRQDISAHETKTRLLAIGVQQADIGIVVADAFPPTKPNPAAVLAVVNA